MVVIGHCGLCDELADMEKFDGLCCDCNDAYETKESIQTDHVEFVVRPGKQNTGK